MGTTSDIKEQIKNLFALLREADTLGADIIYAHLPKKSGLELALYNRMIRAAAHHIINL